MTLSGTVPKMAGVTGIVVKATEQGGLSSAEAFHIYAAAPAAVLAQQSPDVRLHPGDAFSFVVPAGAFTDPLGGTVAYRASQADGTALPAWVQFNPTTGVFSGTMPATKSALSLRVDATTAEGGTGAEGFKIIPLSSPVVLTAQTQDFRGPSGQALSIHIAANTFTDPNGGTETYSIKGADSYTLPKWLSFNAATGTISGTAPASSVATTLGIEVDVATSFGTFGAEAFHVYLAPTVPV